MRPEHRRHGGPPHARDKPFNFTQCMRVEPRPFYAATMKLCEQRCAARGWQTLCAPPCMRIEVAVQTSRSTRGEKACAQKSSKHRVMNAQGDWWPDAAPWKRLIARSRFGAAPPGVEPRWRGKVLRARFWHRDGFWVRAQMVTKQAMWAGERGVPFFVHPYRSNCMHDSGTKCDAYAPAEGPRAAEAWEHYFEPIEQVPLARRYGPGPDGVKESELVEMTCLAASYYYIADIYPDTLKKAWASRAMHAALASAWLRVRWEMRAKAERQWGCHVLRQRSQCDDPRRPAASQLLPSPPSAVMGVHMRGTDKYITERVPPHRMWPVIDGFLRHHNSSTASGRHPRVFLATDDAVYSSAVLARYGADVVAMQSGGALLRARGKAAVWDTRGGGGARADVEAFRRGEEVLIETLLLPSSPLITLLITSQRCHASGADRDVTPLVLRLPRQVVKRRLRVCHLSEPRSRGQLVRLWHRRPEVLDGAARLDTAQGGARVGRAVATPDTSRV